MNPAAILNIVIQVQGAQQAAGQLNNLNSSSGHAHKSLVKLGKVAGLAGIALGGALTKGALDSVAAFRESEKVAKQTESVLKSTGHAAHVTAKQVSELATAISKKTGVDDEAIQSGENLLLTFTNLKNGVGKGNDIFNQTTKIMVDMSAALGQDAKSSAIQLGKALNDPIKGVSALQRVGVSFTADQKKQIKTLVESGKTMDAQKLILRELNKEFGGSAAATATAGDKLKVTFGNLQELIGGKLAPAFDKAATFLTVFIEGMQEGTGAGGTFARIMTGSFNAVRDGAVALGNFLAPAFDRVKAAMQGVSDLVQRIREDFQAGTPATQAITTAVERLAAAYQTLWTAAGPVLGFLVTAVKTYYVTLANLFAAAATFIFQHRDQITAAVMTIRDALITGFNAAKTAVQAAIQFIGVWIDKHRDDIDAFAQAWKNIATTIAIAAAAIAVALKAVFLNVLVPLMKVALDVVKATWPAIRQIIEGALRVIGGLINVFSGVFTGDFGRMWQGVKEIFSGSVKALIGAIKSLGTQLQTVMEGVGKLAIKGLLAGLKGLGDLLLNLITSAFTTAANSVVGFINKIIDVINKIPGVEIKHVAKIEGGSAGNAPSQTGAGDVKLARGGAFARTGGLVNSPITMMGEEAPRHPEYVIPTNPAYRKRAHGLLAQAAGAIGLAKGGINVADYNHVYPSHHLGEPAVRFSPAIVKAIAESQGLPGTLFEQIAHGESQYYPGVVQRDPGDGMVGYGLWQNTPNAWGPGSTAYAYMRMLGGIPALLNPVTNAKMAKFLYDHAPTQNPGQRGFPWYGTQFVGKSGGGGGIFDKVGDVLSALNPLNFIKDLPGTGGLGWLAGAGKNVLGKVGDWIKDKVTGLFPGGGGGAAGDVHGLVPRVLKALAFARSHGWGGTVNSGYRSDAEQVAIWNSGIRPAAKPKSLGGPGSNHSTGEAVDVSDIPGFARAMAMMPESERLYSLVPGDPVHFSVSGHANGTSGASKGWAWVGERGPELVNFGGGERVLSNQDSMRTGLQGYAKGTYNKANSININLPKGTSIKGLPVTPVGTAPASSNAQRAAYITAALAFDKAKNTPPAKGLTGGAISDPIPVAVVSDDTGGIGTSNQDALDALNELVRLATERADLEATLRREAQASLNVSQSQYAVLAQAVTDVVNGQIGGRLGIGLSGLRAPAGAVARL